MPENKNIKRTEILFLYDVKMANPNGDPARDNRPRIVNNKCIVTFDRIKRTVRDYWDTYENKPILLKIDKKGKTREEIVRDATEGKSSSESSVKNYIDVKTFGALLTISSKDKNSKKSEEDDAPLGVMSIIGPVQFSFAETLHEVQELQIEGTTQIQGRENKEAGTFTTKYIIRYGLFAVYGIVDYIRAERQGIALTENDVLDVLKGLWYGTLSLYSTSKIGHTPRFLLTIDHPGNSIIGPDLQTAIKAIPTKDPVESLEDLDFDVSQLASLISPEAEVKVKAGQGMERLLNALTSIWSNIEGLQL